MLIGSAEESEEAPANPVLIKEQKQFVELLVVQAVDDIRRYSAAGIRPPDMEPSLDKRNLRWNR